MCRRVKLGHLLTPHRIINSKWIKDLNVKLQTIKILEENIGNKVSDIAHNNILSDISPQARETKENKQIDPFKFRNLMEHFMALISF